MVFKQPNEKEFEQVKKLVEEFWLDDTDMQPEQFNVLSDGGKILAFGRLREHTDAAELCTIGVAKDFQKKGLGEKMVKHLLDRSKRDVYLVTVIPGFFTKMGFNCTEKYPDAIKKKVELCTKEYHVDEPYFVMKWEKKI
jgi:N-acetylglutamate synthase-like GNAT family acetyltransferase